MNNIVEIKGGYESSIALRNEGVWEKLNFITVSQAVCAFLETIKSEHTRRAYRAAFNFIFANHLLRPKQRLSVFALSNLNSTGDAIRIWENGSESTKQVRVSAFISFTAFLERHTGGVIRKMNLNKASGRETFMRLRKKAKTEAIDRHQWEKFLSKLKRGGARDLLIAKTLIQGAKRISEVLEATIDAINWEKSIIQFVQKKASSLDAVTVITFPKSYMDDLKNYLGERAEGLIFVTRTGKKVKASSVYRSFVSASERSNITKVTPHVLRASSITYLMEKGVSSDEIMKVSGHATPSQVIYYDKSSREKNPTKEYNLI